MRLALWQFSMAWENKARSLERIQEALPGLSRRKLDLVLLPEMSLTGFSMRTELTREQGRETAEVFESLAARYGLAMGFGWVREAGALCENHYTLAGPDGELLDYTKLHPFRHGGEDRFFQGGSSLPVCRYREFCVGVQICYDLRFPEPFQKLSKKAELILVPACWPAGRREHWDTLLRARAIENMVYLAGINCAGELGGQYYSGDSILYAPDGERLSPKEILPGSCPEEKILIYELENDVAARREAFPVKQDRREELYRILEP